MLIDYGLTPPTPLHASTVLFSLSYVRIDLLFYAHWCITPAQVSFDRPLFYGWSISSFPAMAGSLEVWTKFKRSKNEMVTSLAVDPGISFFRGERSTVPLCPGIFSRWERSEGLICYTVIRPSSTQKIRRFSRCYTFQGVTGNKCVTENQYQAVHVTPLHLLHPLYRYYRNYL